MRKLLFLLVLAVVFLSGCTDTPTEEVEYVYDFTVYSGGVMIYHDYVYDYDAIENHKWQLFKTREDKHKGVWTMVTGDAIYKKIRSSDMKRESDLNYPIRFTDTPQPTQASTPVPKATEGEY